MSNEEIIKKNISKMKNFKKKNGRRSKAIIQYEPERPIKSRLQNKLKEKRMKKLTGKTIEEIRELYKKHKIDIEEKFKHGQEIKQENILDCWNNSPKLDVVEEEDEEKKE